MKKRLTIPCLALLLGCLALIGACSELDVGAPCAAGEDDTTGTGSVTGTSQSTINKQALDCRSRLCIKYKETSQPLCTKICDDDDDCPEAGDVETCAQVDNGGNVSYSRFKCVVATTSTSTLKCCKMCVCELELTKDYEAKQTYCDTQGITPDCPELE